MNTTKISNIVVTWVFCVTVLIYNNKLSENNIVQMVDFKFPAKKNILRAALKLQNEIRIDIFFFACLIFDCYL